MALPASSPLPPRTPRGERTRQRLVSAARFVFERDGFSSARITDIAKRAKVAVGSFYTYFDSKDAVFRAVIEAVGEELAAPLPRDVGADPIARILAGNREYVRIYRENARILAVMQHRTFEDRATRELRERGRTLFIERAERAIRRLRASGQIPKDVAPRFVATALCGMVHAFCYDVFALGLAFAEGRREARAEFHEDEVARGLTTLWVRALGITGAEKEIRS